MQTKKRKKKISEQYRTEQHQIHTHIYPQDHENIQTREEHKRTILNSKYGKNNINNNYNDNNNSKNNRITTEQSHC